MITAIFCIPIVVGIGAMIVLPQLENKKHQKMFPASLAIMIPVAFILLMILLIIKVNSGK